MDILENHTRKSIEYLKWQNQIMRKLGSANGFYKMYLENINSCKNSIDCFDYCNRYYKLFLDFNCYDSYDEFFLTYLNDSDVSKSARFVLLQWFQNKGFLTFESFKPVVQAFYPEIGTAGLTAFWKGTYIDDNVLEKVNFTHQILL